MTSLCFLFNVILNIQIFIKTYNLSNSIVIFTGVSKTFKTCGSGLIGSFKTCDWGVADVVLTTDEACKVCEGLSQKG